MAAGAHAAPVTADPLKFDTAIAAFRDRVPLTRKEWDKLDADEQDFAFTVSGVAQADMVTQVWDAVDSAIEDGEDLEKFKDRVSGLLYEQWGAPDASRVENIFRTNVNEAYNDGREAMFRSPEVMADRPIWRYELIDDSDLCDICGECEDVVLPADDDWWDEHRPIQHPNCFPPETRVATEQGWRPIGSVRVGERVLSHDGRYHAVTNVMVSKYRGSLKTIRNAEQLLRLTPNHPVAAEQRWSRADALDVERDQVWVLKGGPGVSNDPPSVFKKHIGELGVRFNFRRGQMPAAAVQFDGDLYGGKTDVHIVSPDGHLQNMRQTNPTKGCRHRRLVTAARLALSALRIPAAFLESYLSAARRLVRVGNLELPFAFAHAAVSSGVVLGDRAHNPRLRQQAIDRRPTAPEPLRQGDGGLPREVERDNFIFHERDRLLAHGFGVSNIDVGEVKYNGIVINLEVEGSRTFVAEGFLVHNCRCSFTALSADEARDEGYESDDDGPDVEVADGFGDDGDWKPDIGDYPEEIGDVLRDEIE